MTYLCVGLGWRRKMAKLLPAPSVSCDVSYYPYFHRGRRQLCAHVEAEREAIVIEMDLCLSLGKRQNPSFPAEPCARCWRGLAQRATPMSPRCWIVLLSALAASRLLWRKFFCFSFLQMFIYLFIYFNNVISTHHDGSVNVRPIERERERDLAGESLQQGLFRGGQSSNYLDETGGTSLGKLIKMAFSLGLPLSLQNESTFPVWPLQFFSKQRQASIGRFSLMLNNWMFGLEPVKIYSPLLSLDPVARQDGIRSQACGLLFAEQSVPSAQEWPVSFTENAESSPRVYSICLTAIYGGWKFRLVAGERR